MFARKFHLPSSIPLFKAKAHNTPFFLIKVVPNTLGYNRYGFVAGKVIDKRATVRNRIKRQVRAEVELLHPTLKQGYDLLCILKKPVTTMPVEEVRKLIKERLMKALS